ncbi:NUDIX hydrolase [Deinococcus cellulosilyticus]|uniref:NUDIX hydrolase n=1 Tax=Deinococcus cellulosilyticus (strain DSM 18568 / NBRC 106333 / KACC 11606 / 5516J-15) TaxID=1223518 RepID=A0A511N426_DEIC1|nr:NUDIX hydrolase [Deinococcus cellulosilyticus]GEM47575.1 NUDIX hydrolase [Deinococcus cellulosilyticus NBRC 106333 = KACC 11606]
MEYVYAVPTALLPKPSPQLQPVTPELYEILSTRGTFLPRPEAEQDETHRQVIPYVITEHAGEYLVMHRTKAGGDQRLHLKYTLGVGGHINPIDEADDPIQAGLEREIEEEIEAQITSMKLLGLILMDDTPVSRVHVGLLYLAQSKNAPLVRETEKLQGEMRPRHQIRDLYDALESWSQLAFDAL